MSEFWTWLARMWSFFYYTTNDVKTLSDRFQLVYEKLITNFKVLKLKLYFLENESLLKSNLKKLSHFPMFVSDLKIS